VVARFQVRGTRRRRRGGDAASDLSSERPGSPGPGALSRARPLKETAMPVLKRPDAEIYYEVYGKGFPLLLYAPGGLRSNIEFWGPDADGKPRSWMDPRKELADRFTVISMDQ